MTFSKSVKYSLVIFFLIFCLYYFLVSDMKFNPTYADDYRSINLPHDYTLKNLTSFFFTPFFTDYFSRGWIVDRPVYYIFLKYIYEWFGGDPYPFYLFRIFLVAILAVLTFIFINKIINNELIAIYSTLFIIFLPPFFLDAIWIKEIWPLVYVFFLISLLAFIKAVKLKSVNYLILFLALAYLTIKTKTDGKILPIIFILFFIINYRKNIFNWKVLIPAGLFLLLISIPIKNPFELGYLEPVDAPKPLVQQFKNVFLLQEFEHPYGVESTVSIFRLPFPFSRPLTAHFSMFGSFGFYMIWFLIFSSILFIYKIKQNQIEKSLTYGEQILVLWSFTATVLIIIALSRTNNDIEVPTRMITVFFPIGLLLFTLFNRMYESVNHKKLYFYALTVIFSLTLISNLFFVYRIRSIDGEQYYMVDEITKAAYAYEHNNSLHDLDMVRIHRDGIMDPAERIILEKYNFIMHKTLNRANFVYLSELGIPFYVVDFTNFNGFKMEMIPQNKTVELIKTVYPCKEGLFCSIKSKIKHALSNKSDNPLAYVYVVT